MPNRLKLYCAAAVGLTVVVSLLCHLAASAWRWVASLPHASDWLFGAAAVLALGAGAVGLRRR